MRTHVALAALLIACLCPLLRADAPVSGIKEEHFDSDPQWDGYSNRELPTTLPTVHQNFGYVETHHSGEAAGEIGGNIQRSSTAAWYALKLDKPLTLNEPIHFEGSFAVPSRGGEVQWGLFNPDDLRQGGRPMNSLMLYVGKKRTLLAFVRLTGTDNRAAGTMVPAGRRVKQSPGLSLDRTSHHFIVDYDPAVHDGRGLVRAIVDDLAPCEFEPPAGFKDEPIKFTHFGMLNGQRPGGPMEVYFDDVVLNGKAFHFDTDPAWEAHGNHTTFQDHEPGGVQNYGFSPTNFAGGKIGEAGGILWNNQNHCSYYGDRVGPFTLSDRIEASGTINMQVAAPDSAALFGFFNADSFKADKKANVIGIIVTAPTRYGHWLRPIVITGDGTESVPREGPALFPDNKPHQWKLTYDPAAGPGGALELTLDGKTAKTELPERLRTEGVNVNHFGFFTGFSGGAQLKLYIDDVRYSSKPQSATGN